MDEGRKENKQDQNRQRSERLSQGYSFIPLLNEAVVLHLSIFRKLSAFSLELSAFSFDPLLLSQPGN